jgi:hypothetical protein
VRRKRDERRLPDDRADIAAEDWLKEFRPVRPDALTSADRDARPVGLPSTDGPARGPGAGHDGRGVRPGPDQREFGRGGPPASRPQEPPVPARREPGWPGGSRPVPPEREDYRGYQDDARPREPGQAADQVRAQPELVHRPRAGDEPAWPDARGYSPAAGRSRPSHDAMQPPAAPTAPDRRMGSRDGFAAGGFGGHDGPWKADVPDYRGPDAGSGRRDFPRPQAGQRPGDPAPGDGHLAAGHYQATAPRDGYPAATDGQQRRYGGGPDSHLTSGSPGFTPGPDGSGRGGYDGGRLDGPGRDGYQASGPRGAGPAAEGFARGPGGYDGARADERGRDAYGPAGPRGPGSRSEHFGSGIPDRERDRGNGYNRARAGDEPRRDTYDRGPAAELRALPASPLPGAPLPPLPAALRPRPPGSFEQTQQGDDRQRVSPGGLPGGRPDLRPADRAAYGPSPIERLVQAAAPRDEDAELTRPLPVILPGANTVPRPGHIEAPRGPFEAARPTAPPGQPPASLPPARPPSITGSVEPPPATFPVADPGPRAGMIPAPVPPDVRRPAPPQPIPEAAVAKLDQIKDLYLTAEAIGEDALDRHFDQVSQRQRDLIREFFDRSGPPAGTP